MGTASHHYVGLQWLTALLRHRASSSKRLTESPTPSPCCAPTDLQSEQYRRTRRCGSDVDVDVASEPKPIQELNEGKYAHNCPPLAEGDTTAYLSDEDVQDDATGDQEADATPVLHELLPYVQIAVAAYKCTNMCDEFDIIHKSQLISNVIDPTHLYGLVGVTDTEAHVCILHDKTVVFAFRGTEPTEWSNGFADILTDLAERQSILQLYKGSSEPTYTSQSHIRVHRGFQNALKDVTDTNIPSQNLLLVLEGLGMQAEDVHSVVCVGHSLGGALATLCAKWCREVAFPRAKIGCVTIGSPRVGNKAFATDFNSKVADGLSYRIVNKRDIVPSIPNLITYPVCGSVYKHVSKPIHFYTDEAGKTCARLGGARNAAFNLGFFDHRSHSYLDSINEVLHTTNPWSPSTHPDPIVEPKHVQLSTHTRAPTL